MNEREVIVIRNPILKSLLHITGTTEYNRQYVRNGNIDSSYRPAVYMIHQRVYAVLALSV